MSDKVNIIMHTKTEGGFIAQHPQTNIDMVEGLDAVLKDKASQNYVDTAIGKIPAVLHDKEDDSVQEVYSPTWFGEGVSICNHQLRSSFPSIDKSGVSITFIGNNSNYGQIYIVNSGEIWSRRSSSKSSWGNWYSSKEEIDKKADQDYVDTAIDKKADREDITNYGSISDAAGVNNKTTEHAKQINASINSSALGFRTQVNSGFNCTVGEVVQSQINASSHSDVLGNLSQINASADSKATGFNNQINASDNSAILGNSSQINASKNSVADNANYANRGGSIVLASHATKISDSMHSVVVGGCSNDKDAEASTQNIKWSLSSESGDIKASGSITGNSSFADFAEYMESSNGKQIPLGTIVALDEGQKIRVAQSGDNPLGIISATAGIILNAQGFEWKDRYLYDRYGQPILVDMEVEDEDKVYDLYQDYIKTANNSEIEYMSLEEFKETLGKIPMTNIKAPRVNPEYNPDEDYTPRSERPEWNVVGMKGQIYVNIDDTVEEHGYIKVGKDGIGTKGIIEVEYEGVKAHKLWQVMEITTPYTEKLGYGIARVII